MSFSYQVILHPSDVKFSVARIPNKFDNGILLNDLLNDLKNGKKLVREIPTIKVIWDCTKWEWYTLNNRRLWVFQEMESCGELTYLGMSRVELIDDANTTIGKTIFKKVQLYEPEWDIRASNNSISDMYSIGNSQTETSTIDLSRVKKEIVEEEEQDVEKKEEQLKTWSICSSKNQSFASLSSITRRQRIISHGSGLYGYGFYHIYRREYLEKIRAAKKRYMRTLKPYDISNSTRCHYSVSSRRNSVSSLSSDIRKIALDALSNSAETELRSNSVNYNNMKCDRKRSISETSDNYCHTSRGKSCIQDWVLVKSRNDTVHSNESDLCSEEVGGGTCGDLCIIDKDSKQEVDSFVSLKQSGFEFAKLYELWQERRQEYFRNIRGQLSVTYGAIEGYLCGLCFKKFKHIVDLQQHSEELLHFACITCGKFFSSYSALGQHCRVLSHKKD